MAYLNIPNVAVRGISACVPQCIDENINSQLIPAEDVEKLIASTGVERRRVADYRTCTSDLSVQAAEKLIKELDWNKKDIECLIFVSQTPDYILPATSCLLQQRLGLSTECYAADVSLGCSGWVYGMSCISSLIQKEGGISKGLLIVGDTILKISSHEDKSTFPLFGDAATVTAIEYQEGSEGLKFHLASDGSGYDSIILPDGGCRSPFNPRSLEIVELEPGIRRNKLHLILDGMDVFSFAISKGPESINKLLERFCIDKETVDYFIFHQANLFLNETVRKKLKLKLGKVPYSLKDFGNTSCATIPLTMVAVLKEELRSKKLNHIGCAFGVGLSWGSVYFTTDHIVCPELIEY